MPALTATEAVSRARELLSLPPARSGTAHLVRRLDREGFAYFIVDLGNHIASVDAATGDLLLSVEAKGELALLSLDDAVARAELSGAAEAELVWKPSAASQSMLDPIWAVSDGIETKYVDQRGRVWETLEAKRPGGGA